MDRRDAIIQAGLQLLQEFGYSSFTQSRVAERAALRQGHLTYYYPTRLDLIDAVAHAAIERQLSALDAALASVSDAGELVERLSQLIARSGNTRVLLALLQAANDEPRLRDVFAKLVDGFVERMAATPILGGDRRAEGRARLLQALVTGLAVVELATGPANEPERPRAILELAFTLLSADVVPSPGTRSNPKEALS